jgi:hypothetical protein
MKSKLSLALAIAALPAVFVISAGAARADLFNWTYIGVGLNGSGTLTTGAADVGFGGFAGFDITGITGEFSFNGSLITGLLPPGTCCGSPANDNIVSFPAVPYLDLAGFAVSTNGGFQVRINFDGTSYDYDVRFNGNSLQSNLGDFTLIPSVVPGPIAGTGLPGLVLACCGLLGWWRRRRKIA